MPENPSAFPGLECRMSLRDWFAGMALQGMIASEAQGDGLMPLWQGSESRWLAEVASKAYLFADAMLAEREKTAD